jgi:hypothetical protein
MLLFQHQKNLVIARFSITMLRDNKPEVSLDVGVCRCQTTQRRTSVL